MRRNYGIYTINEVASELKLSRNTISKVFNDKPGVSEHTRKLVQRYIEQRKRQQEHMTARKPAASGDTIIFSYRLENIEYINGLLSGIEQSTRESGYLLGLNIIDAQTQKPYFPANVYNGSVCGVISFNVYDDAYWEEVLSLGIPSVFLDTSYPRHRFCGKSDIICSENTSPIYSAVHELYRMGRRRFAFLGDPHFCNSLYQRWCAFNGALTEIGLKLDTDASILDDFSNVDDNTCQRRVSQRLSRLYNYPDTYICASDRQAILLIRILKSMSISVPEDIAVLGFDNLPESTRQLPPLSTVDAHSKYQGMLAVRKLLERLHEPTKPYEYIEVGTTLLLRESTGHSSI